MAMSDDTTGGTANTGVVTATASAPAPAPTPAPANVTWPENWRQTYVTSRGGDAKLLNRLERYADPSSAIDALISVQQKIGAGELRSMQPYPEKGTDEEKAAWRTQHGVPDAPDKYELKLKPGLVIGEDDKPAVDSFLKHAHASNQSAASVNAALQWYFDEKERAQAAQAQVDQELRGEVDGQLRVEWGPDYQKNKALITAFLETGPAGTKDLVMNARLTDGTPLASNINVLRWLVDKARDYNPAISVVPGDSATQLQAVEREMADLTRMSAAPRNSPEFQKYWREGGEKRLRELIQAKERISRKT